MIVQMESGGAGAEPSCTLMRESAMPNRAQDFRSERCRIGRPNRRRHFFELRDCRRCERHSNLSRRAAAAALQASTRLPRADTRTGSHRKAGKARCAAIKFTGQDGLAKLGEFPEPRRAEHDTTLLSLRQQDSLLPSARACNVQPRKRCPLFRCGSAISCHPRVGFLGQSFLVLPSRHRDVCTQRGCWSLPTKVGPPFCRPARGREYKKLNTAHRGLLRSTSIPHPNFFVPSHCNRCSPWLLSPTSSMPPPNSSSPSSRRTSPSCKRPIFELRSHLTPRVCEHVLTLSLDWIADAGLRPRRSSS